MKSIKNLFFTIITTTILLTMILTGCSSSSSSDETDSKETETEVNEVKDEVEEVTENDSNIEADEIPESLLDDLPFPDEFQIYSVVEYGGHIQIEYVTPDHMDEVHEMYVEYLNTSSNILEYEKDYSQDPTNPMMGSWDYFALTVERGMLIDMTDSLYEEHQAEFNTHVTLIYSDDVER